MTFLQQALVRFEREFGVPSRRTAKVIQWSFGPETSAVIQIDQPASGESAFVWLPYPADDGVVPENATEYPGEAGRHSNTYPAPGLRKGLPAIRLVVSTRPELQQAIDYIGSIRDGASKPKTRLLATITAGINSAWSHLTQRRVVTAKRPQADLVPRVDSKVPVDLLPEPKQMAPRREAITRAVQREVWQRDGGRCVECSTREKLCFDHIVPFSRGGSNTVRNIQLLCERCNTSKGNRI